ncbi:MAG: hypothetical protein ACTSVI_13470 [Promethearchaeota archaeon]
MTSTGLHPKRKEALQYQTTFNQIRNSVGILIEFMENVYGEHENITKQELELKVIEKLRIMGHNIAKTYVKYWEPEIKGLDQMLLSIYNMIFNSKVVVTHPTDKRTLYLEFRKKKVFLVEDSSCPLCKGKRATNIAGCEIEMGVVEGIFEELDKKYPDKEIPLLKADHVLESKTRGDMKCVHRYYIDRPETTSYNQLI